MAQAGPGSVVNPVDASFARGNRLLALRAVQYGLAFISGVVIARALGPDGRAAYALPLNLAGIVLVSVHLSVELAVARLVARSEATFAQLAQVGITAALVLGPAGLVLMATLGLPLRDDLLGDASETAVWLAGATIGPTIAGQVAAALLFRRGVLLRYGLVQAAQGLLQLGLLAVVVLGGGLTPEATLAINLAVLAGSAAALLVILRLELGSGSLRPSTDRRLLARVVRTGLVLHASSLALFLNLRLDLLLVGTVLDVRRAGIYSLAVTLAELGIVATTTLSLAALKDQTDLAEGDAAEFTAAFARRTLCWALLYAVIASAVSYPFIRIAYGAEWTDAVVPFILLCVAVVALSIEAPARGLLLRIGLPWTVSAAASVGLLVNLVANFILLEPLGLVGAALASIASYWVIAALMVYLVRRATRGLVVKAPTTQASS